MRESQREGTVEALKRHVRLGTRRARQPPRASVPPRASPVLLLELSAEREPVYAGADVVVDTTEGPHETAVATAMAALAVYVEAPGP